MSCRGRVLPVVLVRGACICIIALIARRRYEIDHNAASSFLDS